MKLFLQWSVEQSIIIFIWVKLSLVYSHNETEESSLCETKKEMPFLSNDDLAKELDIGKLTVQGILVSNKMSLGVKEDKT